MTIDTSNYAVVSIDIHLRLPEWTDGDDVLKMLDREFDAIWPEKMYDTGKNTSTVEIALGGHDGETVEDVGTLRLEGDGTTIAYIYTRLVKRFTVPITLNWRESAELDEYEDWCRRNVA